MTRKFGGIKASPALGAIKQREWIVKNLPAPSSLDEDEDLNLFFTDRLPANNEYETIIEMTNLSRHKTF